MSIQELKQIKNDCASCNVKFNVWISMAGLESERESIVRNNFFQHCPACRTLEKEEKEK
ncbi:MAG: hypothetical protein Q7S82_02165 [bacterium]|nr:hypothetical protein [bacterium]